jgi:hypothetical protein
MLTGNFVLVEQAKTAQPMSNIDIHTRDCGIGDVWSMYHGSLAQCGPVPSIVTHVEQKEVAAPKYVTDEVTSSRRESLWEATWLACFHDNE